jgi:hypothetical protein
VFKLTMYLVQVLSISIMVEDILDIMEDAPIQTVIPQELS